MKKEENKTGIFPAFPVNIADYPVDLHSHSTRSDGADTPRELIDRAAARGGIAIMAHPYLVNEPVSLPDGTMDRASYIERLIAAGLDGIEACYPYAKTSYGDTLTPQQIEEQVRSSYEGRLAIISGGSDYHADYKKGVSSEKARDVGECGITLEYFKQNALLQEILQKNLPSGL